ncbi:hypothetical protein HDU76_010288 [Blyttiomyces sp. JEL0837]|nr:hypothetical protein HDU76_010288 [Blyttiomyces sp. JEL0837]
MDNTTMAVLALPPAPQMRQSKSVGERQRITPRSQVLVYEVQLKELFDQYPRSPSKERVRKCFTILEEIIPFLGTLAPIVKVIKEELYRSVYSKNLTSCDVEPFVERIPYFSSAGRMDDARTEEASRTTEALTELQQKVKFRDHDLQLLYRKNMNLKQELSDKEAYAKSLEEKIRKLEDMNHQLDMDKGEMRLYQASKEDSLKREIEKLQTSLAQSNHIIEKLTVFKTSYNEGTGDALMEEEKEKSKLELNIDSLGMLEYDIYQAERLDEQFAEILNYQLDDFEMSLSQLKKKREILSGVMTNESDREASYKLELHEIVASFRKRVSDLLEEQRLLKVHTKSLKMILDDYLSEKKTIQRTADVALRKYSITLQVSEDNAETFEPLKWLKYCGKCGEKTVLCPHKEFLPDPITINPNWTHIRLTRPPLKLRTGYMKRIGDPTTPATGTAPPPADEDSEQEPDTTEDEMFEVSKTMKLVWQEFYDVRGGTKPRITRAFQLPRLLGLIQEIYDSRWSYEEDRMEMDYKDDDVSFVRFVDYFYDFFFQRYQIPEVALKAAHDFITALGQYEADDANIAIFVRHLCGLDDVTWKYIYLARKLFAKYDIINTTKYRQILGIMYPSRTREMYEQMELELVAFSKNKFSKEIVEEHLLHMLLTMIEPNQKFFMANLKRFDYQETGSLTYEDFDEAVGQLLPVASAKLKRSRYRLSELDFKRDQVPIQRLAQVASYISLYSCYKNSWVPQALILPDFGFNNELGGKGGDGDGKGSNEGLQDVNQQEVDSLLSTESKVKVDMKAVEEEEMKLIRRLEVMDAEEMHNHQND